MKIKILITLLTVAAISLLFSGTALANDKTIQLFWAEGCPHCYDEKLFLDEYLKDKTNIHLEEYEISNSQENLDKMNTLAKSINADVNGVPFTVIGDKYIVGFSVGSSEQKIINILETGETQQADDGVCTVDEPCLNTSDNESTINLPIIGTINTENLSLPVLTILLGFIDGFNPCAMWVLIFLIGALMGMNDKKRMWIIGSVFIIASGLVYFLFMAAWLNFFLFIGLVSLVRIAIGVLAFGVGSYNLKEYFTKKEVACKIEKSNKRKKVFERITDIIHQKSLFISLVGIIILAFAVNLVELICSAGLPAIYTQVLSLSNLPVWQYYAYLLMYLLFFMLDDLLVFFIAMKTLQLSGITTKYTRLTKLIGGIIMLILGLLLIIKPEWLMFG